MMKGAIEVFSLQIFLHHGAQGTIIIDQQYFRDSTHRYTLKYTATFLFSEIQKL